MKECPVCKAACFDDMEVCFGCLYRFDDEAGLGKTPSEQMSEALSRSRLNSYSYGGSGNAAAQDRGRGYVPPSQEPGYQERRFVQDARAGALAGAGQDGQPSNGVRMVVEPHVPNCYLPDEEDSNVPLSSYEDVISAYAVDEQWPGPHEDVRGHAAYDQRPVAVGRPEGCCVSERSQMSTQPQKASVREGMIEGREGGPLLGPSCETGLAADRGMLVKQMSTRVPSPRDEPIDAVVLPAKVGARDEWVLRVALPAGCEGATVRLERA